MITDGVAALPPATARAVEQQVLTEAPEQTTGQLRAALGRAIAAVDPEGVDARRRRAVATRAVTHYPDPTTGTATIQAGGLDAVDALAVWTALDGYARSLGSADPRGMDARRADALVLFCTGRPPLGLAPEGVRPDPMTVETAAASTRAGAADGSGGDEATHEVDELHESSVPPRVQLQLAVSADTLAGPDDEPAWLADYGWITPRHARGLLCEAEVFGGLSILDPGTGVLVAQGPYRRADPTALEPPGHDRGGGHRGDNLEGREPVAAWPSTREGPARQAGPSP